MLVSFLVYNLLDSEPDSNLDILINILSILKGKKEKNCVCYVLLCRDKPTVVLIVLLNQESFSNKNNHQSVFIARSTCSTKHRSREFIRLY